MTSPIRSTVRRRRPAAAARLPATDDHLVATGDRVAPIRGRAVAVVVVAAGLLVAVLGSPAAATWSLVAVDPETGEVGAAMAGCSPVAALGSPDAVLDPIALVPGRGVAVAQASVDPERLAVLARLLEDLAVGGSGSATAGGSAAEVLAQVTDPLDDDLVANRQYAVAALAGGTAAHTGDEVGTAGLAEIPIDAFSGDRTAERAAGQGVLVTDAAVVDDAVTAYLAARADGRPLAGALARGLLAGSQAGGDPDCPDQTALYAHVAVARPGDEPSNPTSLLTVTVDADDGQNPVTLLVAGVDEGERGWLDAGRRPARRLSRLVVLVLGVIMAIGAVAVIRHGMGYRLGRPAGRRRA